MAEVQSQLLCILVILTFWPLNGITGHLCNGLHFCQVLVSTQFCSLLRVRHRTDRQTDDGRQCLMPTPWCCTTVSLFRFKDGWIVCWYSETGCSIRLVVNYHLAYCLLSWCFLVNAILLRFLFNQPVFPEITPVQVASAECLPKKSLWGLLVQDVLQAGCPSCHPINSVKALKGVLLNMRLTHSSLLLNFVRVWRLPPAERRGYTSVFNALYRITSEEGLLTLWRVCSTV